MKIDFYLGELIVKNSIIIPRNYERAFIYEAKRDNLIRRIDFGDDFDKNDEYEDLEDAFLKNNRIRQNLFQMILLYDNIIFPDMDPTFDCSTLKSMDDFSIYSFQDLLEFDAIHQEGHVLFADHLKSAITPVITRDIKKYFSMRDNTPLKDIVSEIYDVTLGIEKRFSNKIEELIELNKFVFDLRHREYFRKMTELRAPSSINEDVFFTVCSGLVLTAYEDLCWQLEISNTNDAYIINCEYQLAKIGCNDREKNISDYLDAYKILKCECSKIMENLPKMNNLREVFELKEKRRHDVKNLREVLANLEYVLRTEGKEQAIEKASRDVTKASKALSIGKMLSPVGKWTTLFSVPIGVAEMLLKGVPPMGLAVSCLGTIDYIANERLKRKNGWCEIVR